MDPKHMGRLGVFYISEAILSVLEQEPEGLRFDMIGEAVGIPDDLSENDLFGLSSVVQGVLKKLQSEGYVESATGTRWKIVSRQDNNTWTVERFRELISGEKYEETYISKGHIQRLSKLGADLMDLVAQKQWVLSYRFLKYKFVLYFNGKKIFGVKLNTRRPRLCIWLPEQIVKDKENDLITTGKMDRRHEGYYDWDNGFAAYPADVEVANIEDLLEFTYLYRIDQLD